VIKMKVIKKNGEIRGVKLNKKESYELMNPSKELLENREKFEKEIREFNQRKKVYLDNGTVKVSFKLKK